MTTELDQLHIQGIQEGKTGYGLGNLNNYQRLANSFINEPRYEDEMDYLMNTALGLTGEGGEFADIIKKVKYHGHVLDEATRLKLEKELGDILWYIAQGCKALNVSLTEVATLNIRKLADRHSGGKFSEEASINKDESKEGWSCGRCLQLREGIEPRIPSHSPRCKLRGTESEDTPLEQHSKKIKESDVSTSIPACIQHGEMWTYGMNSVKYCLRCNQPLIDLIEAIPNGAMRMEFSGKAIVNDYTPRTVIQHQLNARRFLQARELVGLNYKEVHEGVIEDGWLVWMPDDATKWKGYFYDANKLGFINHRVEWLICTIRPREPKPNTRTICNYCRQSSCVCPPH